MLRKFVVMIDDGVALSNVIEQATYMAKSLGKFDKITDSSLVSPGLVKKAKTANIKIVLH